MRFTLPALYWEKPSTSYPATTASRKGLRQRRFLLINIQNKLCTLEVMNPEDFITKVGW